MDVDERGLSRPAGPSLPIGRSTAAHGESSTVSDGPRPPDDERSAVGEIGDWGRRYLRSHPLMSLGTVGGQVILGVRTFQYFFVDLFSRRFRAGESVRQAAFTAGTAFVPTLFVTIPIGVTLSIEFSLLAGQVGATSLSGAATGMVVIRQGAPLVAAILLASAVGSAVCADLGARTMREGVDAMEVMGVSVIRRLVVPRFAAVIVVPWRSGGVRVRRRPGGGGWTAQHRPH
jgi:phospholipid/cholesterol/gamma-HCH transport system permease protein